MRFVGPDPGAARPAASRAGERLCPPHMLFLFRVGAVGAGGPCPGQWVRSSQALVPPALLTEEGL